MDADEDFFDKFKDESYDDFFTREQPSQPAKPSPQDEGPSFFAIHSDDDDGADGNDGGLGITPYTAMPQAPSPEPGFSSEDLQLHGVLGDFYSRFNVQNLANVNRIVEQYRASNLTHLFAALAAKYSLPAPEVIELVASSLYISSPFEFPPAESQKLDAYLQQLEPTGAAGIRNAFEDPGHREELFISALQSSADASSAAASSALLHFLCLRGIPSTRLRPQVWQVLLGVLPQNADTDVLQAEKRKLYESQKSCFLVPGRDKLEIKASDRPLNESLELLSQIQKDVQRTRQEEDLFQQTATRNALISALFVYAQLHEARYVQGMNEILATFFYVFVTAGNAEFAEHDAFWCFSHLMQMMKPGFMTGDHSTDGMYAQVNTCESLLRKYDPELARHLVQHGSPHFAVAFRWCTLLFAQDASLPDLLRLWDSFIGDPMGYELVVYACLASLLSCRDELLAADDEFQLAEIMRGAPRRDVNSLQRRAWAICALERRVQTPPFPARSVAQVVEQIAGWAQGAASKAQDFVPVVKDTASRASAAAKEASKEKVHSVQHWLKEAAPARQEVIDKAQTRLSALVQATGAAATRAAQTFVETM